MSICAPEKRVGMNSVMHEDFDISNSLEKSKNLSGWVADRLDGLRIPDPSNNKRSRLAMACQHLAIEHAQAIIALVDNEFYGSTLALQRPLFEAVIRGVWLRYSATDEEVDKAARGIFPNSERMTRNSPPPKDQNDAPPLRALKDKWWNHLCGYTHGGSEQILARLDHTGLRANYQRDEVMAALLWSDMIHLYSGVEMADAAFNEALSQTFLERMIAYEEVSKT